MAGETNSTGSEGGAGGAGNTGATGTTAITSTGAETKNGATGTQTSAETKAVEFAVKYPEAWGKEPASGAKFTAIAKELALKSDGGQKLVDWANEQGTALLEAASKARESELQKEQQSWVDALKADAEFAGDKFDPALKSAQRAMTAVGTPALKQFLEETGLGNHPEMVRAFARMGAKLGEDKLDGKQTVPGKVPLIDDEARLAEALFNHPSSKSMFTNKE